MAEEEELKEESGGMGGPANPPTEEE